MDLQWKSRVFVLGCSGEKKQGLPRDYLLHFQKKSIMLKRRKRKQQIRGNPERDDGERTYGVVLGCLFAGMVPGRWVGKPPGEGEGEGEDQEYLLGTQPGDDRLRNPKDLGGVRSVNPRSHKIDSEAINEKTI